MGEGGNFIPCGGKATPPPSKKHPFSLSRAINYSRNRHLLSLRYSQAHRRKFSFLPIWPHQLLRIWDYFVHSLPSHCAPGTGRSSLSSSHAPGKEPADPHTPAGLPCSRLRCLLFTPRVAKGHENSGRILSRPTIATRGQVSSSGTQAWALPQEKPWRPLLPASCSTPQIAAAASSPEQPQLENLFRAPSSQPLGSRKYFNFHRKGSI